MNFFKIIFLVGPLLWCNICFGGNQNHASLIKGKITNQKNEPLAFANIFLKGGTEGTISNEWGEFSFLTRATGKVILICSFIGYAPYEKTLELPSHSDLILNIQLRQELVKGEQIMITASAFTASAEEEGVTLTALDVVRTPGAAADLFWAIKSFPGLQQVEEGAGLFVRGGDVSENVILLDGAIINHPYKYESPTGGYFGTFNPFLLKGTFFSSGGFSAQYGEALSGALAMESLDLPDQRKAGIGLGLAAESIFLSLPVINDKLGFFLSGNHSNTKMMFEMNNNRKEFSQYPFSYDLNLNAVFKINADSQLKFFLFRESDQIGVEVDDPDYPTQFHGNSASQLYHLRYSSLVKKKFLIQANLAFNNFRRQTELAVMNLDTEDQLFQSKLDLESEVFTSSYFRCGLAFFRYQTVISGIVAQEKMDMNPLALIQLVDTDYVSNRCAQFFELENFLPFGIKLISGIRGQLESISKQYVFDPRISILYVLTTHSNLSASWGIYQQYPEPKYYDRYMGNTRLSAMKARHFILGYAFQQENKMFRLEGYYKKYDKLLLADEQFHYSNDGHGYAMGLDAFIKNSLGPISGWISYSWLKARRKWLDLPVLAPPYFDITHNVTGVLNFNLLTNLSLGGSFRYATGKPYTPAPKKYNQARVPSYQKWDVTFSYLHHFFASNLTVFYFSISNLFDRINIFDYRYSADFKRKEPVDSAFGRMIYFGAQFNW